MGKTELKIEIDADLLAHAKASGRDLAELVEESIRNLLGSAGMAKSAASPLSGSPLTDKEKGRRWAEENAGALEAQRKRIEEIGVFGEDLRTW